MTEYDYSEEGRRRYVATQNRIAKWVHQTESAPTLKSPFTPRSHTGSAAPTVYPSQSISQAPMSPSPSTHHSQSSRTSSSSHRSHHSHGHQHHRSPTYIISPPPSPGYAHGQRPHGVIILPRRGQAPSVVYY
ncbi:hypothetical protein B0H11DRAFT_1361150 [Mycena galericulata]|nr:hypothetical protein B0H11DRAFT_1361150 [Mycena galericulata]